MNNNQINALITLLGGLGVIPVMFGIFTKLDFMVGVIIGMIFWISCGAVTSLLAEEDEDNQFSSQFCSTCGKIVEEFSQYCVKCGNVVVN